MLFCEFQEGTGCKDNEYNHKVYEELEIIYMNTDCTKEHIYDMGKKLVDNSKTEEQIRFENEIKEQIKNCKEEIKYYKSEIELKKNLLENEWEEYWIAEWKRNIKFYREQIKILKNRIIELKWILG